MSRAIFYIPHPDDETLSMWPAVHLLAGGYDVHFVFMSRGGVTPASIRIDAAPATLACAWADHAYKHNPDQEGYAVPTVEQVGEARLHEGIGAVGAMAMISPTTAGQPGHAFWHDENLPTQWGNGTGSGAPSEDGIAACDEIIRRYIADYPNSFHYTMSPTDDHPDHAACGAALRRLKGTPWLAPTDPGYLPGDPALGPGLANAMFFVSKLYWGGPGGVPPRPADVLAERCGWYPNVYPQNTLSLARLPEYTAHLRTRVVKPYFAWSPAEGAYAVAVHQVSGQFWNAIQNPAITISALWHP